MSERVKLSLTWKSLVALFLAPVSWAQVGILALHVSQNSEAAHAGITDGDIISAWSQGSRHGDVPTPFDFRGIEREWGSRGMVKLLGRRGTKSTTWELDSFPWGVLPMGIWSAAQPIHLKMATLASSEKWAELASYCNEVCRDPGLPLEARAWELFEAATWLSKGGQSEQASLFYTAAIEEGGRGSLYLESQIYEAWGDSYANRKRWSEATAYYLKALSSVPLGEKSLNSAFYLDRIALFASRSGAIADALHYAQRALTIRKQLCAGCAGTINTLNVVGVLAQESDDLSGSQDALQEALSLSTRLGQTDDLSTIYNNLGGLAVRRGDLGTAERYFLSSLKNKSKSQSAEHLWDNLGLIALARANPKRAEEYFQESLLLQRTHGMNRDTAATLNNLAIACAEANQQSRAEGFARDALRLEETDSEPGGMAKTLDTLGWVLRKRGHLGEAELMLTRALGLEEKEHEFGLDVAETTQHLGEVYQDQGEAQKATAAYLKAIEIRRLLVPTSAAYAESLASAASIEAAAGSFDKAAEHYQNAVYALERQTEDLGGFSDTIRLHGRYTAVYRQLVSVMMHLGQVDRAFEVLDRSRAQGLLQMLQEGSVNLRAGASNALLTRDRSVRQRLASLENERVSLLVAHEAGEKVSRVDTAIRELQAENERIVAQMRTENPHYAALTQPKQLGLRQLQQLLDSQSVVLEYMLAPDQSYVFALSRQKLQAFALGDRRMIDALAREVYAKLGSRDLGASPANESAERLGRVVLGPLAGIIRKYNKITVIGDGGLQYIPFAALRLDGRALIEAHEVSFATAASTLNAHSSARHKYRTEVAILADPVFSRDDPRVHEQSGMLSKSALGAKVGTRGVMDAERGLPDSFSLSRLVNSRAEANAIFKVMGGSASRYFDFDASRRTALSGEIAQSRIVHLATHGFLDARNPQLSGLIFSLVDRKGDPQVGFLGLEEIFTLRLPVDLVVLSACQTALGEEIDGQGLLGITAGFKFAGARQVVASLWNVDDSATAEFMAEFYRHLHSHGVTVASALRGAQLKLLHSARWESPYFWAAFEVESD